MLSINNDNTKFGANIVTTIKSTDTTKIKSICNKFSEATIMYPKEVLNLNRSKNNKRLTLSTYVDGQKISNKSKQLSIGSLEKYLKTMPEEEFVNKLVKAFKVLRLSETYKYLKNSIQTNKEKYENNINIAEKLRKLGKSNFAEKYENIAKYDKEKLTTLNTQINEVQDRFYKQREEFSKTFPELKKVDIK